MPDWNLQDLVAAVHGSPQDISPLPITGFSIDSRTIKPGEAFFAIKGENYDGHAFIENVLKTKAGAIVANTFPSDLNTENTRHQQARCACIQVSGDTLEALQMAAKWHRARHSGRFVGVTGSNGKTSTKEMLSHLFSIVGKTWATSGNLNNHIGLPLNLVRIPLSTETAIIEMGMNHPGEIRLLAEIAKPRDGLITNIGPAHIGLLGSLQNIAHAKGELLENLPVDGFAVLPGDDQYFSVLKEKTKAQVVKFGFGTGNDISGRNLAMTATGLTLDVHYRGHSERLNLQLLGQHNALNALAAIAMFVSHGKSLSEGIHRMSEFKPVSARLESHEIEGLRVILDCYNANPSSMKGAIEFLSICPGRRIAVLGDMRELGEQGPELHRKLGEQIASAKIDQLVAVGELSQEIAEAALKSGMAGNIVHPCSDTCEASKLLATLLLQGDTVLLKASRGMHFETIVKDLWPSLKTDLH
ncbi:MAG: UDP-N-acetylmuramoyl-tripeptide--D-alanyl-D-alanine ligase [Candidatus Riflebacteria bacterium]|nr:UDP-N-acetylmuramoyl-tripeptide--D-alanyl-D-alanine ligase [Candidatus Riflebacteria bacterium]